MTGLSLQVGTPYLGIEPACTEVQTSCSQLQRAWLHPGRHRRGRTVGSQQYVPIWGSVGEAQGLTGLDSTVQRGPPLAFCVTLGQGGLDRGPKRGEKG